MKYLILLALTTLFLMQPRAGFSQNAKVNSKNYIADLKRKKTAIEKYLFKHRKSIVVLVKVYGKKKLVRVKKDDWPENMDIVYNVLKDSTGRVILISKMPYSESGDWYLAYKHYFNNNGKTFAFSNAESRFDNSVKDEIVRLNDVSFYNIKFQLIYKSHSLTDVKGKPIKRNVNEFDFHDDKGISYKNVYECLKAYGLIKYISTVKQDTVAAK